MIDLAPVERFGLLLVRPGMLVMAVPLFGGVFAPMLLRVGLLVILGTMMLPAVTVPTTLGPAGIAALVAREALIGLALAMGIRVLVAGAEFGGHLASFQIGFGYASLVDPQTGVRNNLLSSFYSLVAMVVMFGIDAHHEVVRALALSYEMLPLGPGGVDGSMAGLVARMLGTVFVVGVQLAAPVVIVLIVVELALGLLSRAAPTLNLMAQGFPVRLLVGLLALAGTVRVIPGVVKGLVPAAIDLGARVAVMLR
jgi:flagellar biosynthetic protein FliR